MKMWAGRFKQEEDSRVNDFNSSISFDSRMYRQDIMGSIAHATMLGKVGILTQEETTQLVEGLQQILQDIEEGKLTFDPEAEDIHMFVEAVLTQRLGTVGKKLHTSRSRNDQVALDNRMYLMDEMGKIDTLLRELLKTICDLAQQHTHTVMPGYTHMQRAQPVTFGHHLMAYAQMFLRDLDRLADCKRRTNVMPLGSGALAGTTHPIDRQMVCDLLHFDCITPNSMDGVSDRDYCIELANVIALIMMHLSRFSEEMILWCSWEFKFIELDDAFSTGSSIMPQKKNPDIAELVRGKTARVYGDLMALLAMMKSLPLAYNKDMQEDKEAIFDAVDTVKLCLTTFTPMLATVTVLKDNMKKAAAKGFINATDCADYLVRKGIAFRDAYKVTGQLVAVCIDTDNTLDSLPLSVYQQYCDAFGEDIYDAIDMTRCVMDRSVAGGPSPKSVELQIAQVRGQLAE